MHDRLAVTLLLVVTLLAGSLVLAGPAPAVGPPGEPRDLELVRLAEGVYASVAKPGGTAVANAGLVDLGDEVLVFDAHLSPEAGRELEEAARRLLPRPVRWLVLSHHHQDHAWGAAGLGTPERVVATALTARALEKEPRDLPEARRRELQGEVRRLEGAPPEPAGSRAAAEARLSIGYCRALLEVGAEAHPPAPSLLVTGELEIRGSRRRARLVEAPASTGGDLFLHLPDDGIVFTGDAVFAGMHPFLTEADPDAWERSLAALEALGARVVVPGHGPPGDGSAISDMLAYIRAARRAAAAPGEVTAVEVPAPFASWAYPGIFEGNVRYLRERARTAAAP